MDIKQLEGSIEAILFASGEPVSLERLSANLEMEPETIEAVINKLEDYYKFERRGIRLIRIEDCFQLCSAPEFADVVRRTLENRKPAKLSQAALEALAIVAYNQPTTRAYVDQVRGVDSTYTMGLLLDRGLIEECGRLAVPGRPLLFKTTQEFLRVFGLKTIEDLPELVTNEEGEQLTMQMQEEIQRMQLEMSAEYAEEEAEKE